MTKSELIDRLAAQFPQLVAKDAELAVKMILEAMAESLSKGERIEIRGFGSFGLNYRPPRTGRNPKSGDKVQVPEKLPDPFHVGCGKLAQSCGEFGGHAGAGSHCLAMQPLDIVGGCLNCVPERMPQVQQCAIAGFALVANHEVGFYLA